MTIFKKLQFADFLYYRSIMKSRSILYLTGIEIKETISYFNQHYALKDMNQ